MTLEERQELAEGLLRELDGFSAGALCALADGLDVASGRARLFSTAIRWAAISKEEGRPLVDVVTTVAMSTALYTAGIGPDGKAFRDRLAGSPAGFWRHVGEALERVEGVGGFGRPF